MGKPHLAGYKISKAEFTNNLLNGQKIELEHKYSYSVRYSDNGTCVGEFKADVCDKNNPGSFHINVVIHGSFRFDSSETKEALHLETYDALFPYVRAYVSTITSAGGVPPVMIPYIDISNQTIYRMDLSNRDDGDE